MSQDPNQEPYSGYGSTPENPYGTPPQEPYQEPYNAPPPQNPYGAYGTPPPPPPQGGYAVPPQGGYGTPPPGYGMAGPGYAPVQGSPLPLGEAIRQLPEQYRRVVTKPSAATFAAELGKASWDIVWVQLLIYAVISAIVGYLSTLTNPAFYTVTPGTSGVDPNTIRSLTGSISLGEIVIVPIGFFIGVGILYLIAKAFRGTGTYLQQSYATLLFDVPLGILSALVLLIPFLGGLLAFALSIYRLVLTVFSIMAVHRLSGGKATAVVLIPVLVVFLLVCGLIVLLISILAATIHR